MKEMPEIGARVRYTGKGSTFHKTPCTGTVVAQYPGYISRDTETGEIYMVPDSIGMEIDELPDWWCYTGSRCFAPDIDAIEYA